MCGIIGYIGDKQVLPILIDGLRRLEYRGYDSAGVAVVRNGGIELRRSAGKLARLEVRQFARAATQIDAPVAHDRDAGRIVPAIFKAPKSVDEYRDDVFRSDVADDSTHKYSARRGPTPGSLLRPRARA